VQHLLDCDADDPGCELDLDVYINGNFTPADLRALRWNVLAQGIWGSSAAATQTIPNLLTQMDATKVEQAVILPIVFGFPFGDDLNERWHEAIDRAEAAARLRLGASVHPGDPDRIAKLEAYAARGARIVKLHPPLQRFYPDADDAMEIYAACERLGLGVFFHCGRAGIEPESTHRYALPRHYEGALASFPNVPFVLGHGGARDAADALDLAMRYENAWLGAHGQSVTQLAEMLRRTGGERLLFGSDWPFYHLAASLAKVLITTEGEPELRTAVLRGNAERLLELA
jgi:predicted TIM-barrel fold metal-dependent hydrolase